MSAHSREKIALAVFAALIVLSLCGLGWYLLAGHSWNVAASNIDDTFGSMDGYTAIVYAGTAEVPEEAAKAEAGGTDRGSRTGYEAAVGAGGSAAGGAADAAGGTEERPDAPAAADEPEPDPSERPEAATGKTDTAEKPGAAAGKAAPSASGQGSGAGAADEGAPVAATSAFAKDAKPAVSVDDAQASYEDKNAVVFSLDTTDVASYSEGTILKKGGHRFGVFGVSAPSTPRALERQVAYFEKHGVDFIVAITSDKAFVDDATGIDIVISTQDEGLFVMGETIDGTFYVDAPEVGKVGAILISPSNVVSAKVIEEL